MSVEAAIPSTNQVVRFDKKSTVSPCRPSQRQHCKLCPSDLQMLYFDYIQKGLFYHMPFADDNQFFSAVEVLKKSLAEVLVHFYPLAGRLITSADGILYIDCNDAGVDLIEASAPDVGIQEVASTEADPGVVGRLFSLDGAINVDGRFLPLLVVQVTKLRDGVALGFTVNHVVVDGTSLWNFINSWADLCRGATTISHPPLHSRCFDIKDSHIALELPQTLTINNFSPPQLREKVFHFSKKTILRLKDRANRNRSEDSIIISSFQALCAHMWQAITRARGLLPHEPTTFKLSVNCRGRLVPPLPFSYFGNVIQLISTTVTVGELLAADISSTASLLHHIVSPITDGSIRAELQRFNEHPSVMKPSNALYVKVSMDGAPYLRKVDLKMYSTYHELSSALEKMFSCFTMGQCGAPGLSESKLIDLLNGSEYVPTYEDKDGDWMLVGDVPWEMFVDSCKRLRITKASEAIGLAPRAMEKSRSKN